MFHMQQNNKYKWIIGVLFLFLFFIFLCGSLGLASCPGSYDFDGETNELPYDSSCN